MTEKIKISQAIIVEGKYDKIKLSSFIDGLIVETNGFGIFKNQEKKEYLKKLAEERGLLIITDSDSAGFIIRNHLKSFIDNDKIFNAYIKRVEGKEKRKPEPSKEGVLGVEGLSRQLILEAIENSGINKSAVSSGDMQCYNSTDLFNLGLTGRDGSRERKKVFLKALGLPEYLSNSALLKYMNTVESAVVEEAMRKIL